MFFFFKQKTAYEIRLSLVGSEMSIRDSCMPASTSLSSGNRSRGIPNTASGLGCPYASSGSTVTSRRSPFSTPSRAPSKPEMILPWPCRYSRGLASRLSSITWPSSSLTLSIRLTTAHSSTFMGSCPSLVSKACLLRLQHRRQTVDLILQVHRMTLPQAFSYFACSLAQRACFQETSQQQSGGHHLGRIQSGGITQSRPVSYTHLTLPKNREV